MGVLSRDRSTSQKHHSDDAPSYDFISTDMLVSVGTATVMMLFTIAGMVAISFTPLADLGIALYEITPILGVVVFGGLITLGRYAGVKGMVSERIVLGFGGALVSVFAYSWFGGAILSLFSSDIYALAIGITSLVTVGITFLAALLVFGTDYDFSWTGTASAVCMVIGIIGVLGLSIINIPALGLIAFLFILLGFLFDLVYEIYLTSDNARTPLANGIGIYIAFAGVFVNILQIVLQLLSQE